MLKRLFILTVMPIGFYSTAIAGIVEGKVTDAETGDPLIGASITLAEGKGISTDVNGRFSLNIPRERCQLTIRYIGYKTSVRDVKVNGSRQAIEIKMQADNTTLAAVTVTGEARHDTEAASTREQQASPVAMTSVSEQHIKRTQDKNASEVIRRIPGVSIIDEKFVMVRGLSQRYNNVWMNGSAVPSSEADQRAFSFDIIPSSQLSNMKVVKTASPDYPADFTGGFILVNTKDVPLRNTWSISVGGSHNSMTHLQNQLYYQGSCTDWLGFDSGKRGLKDGINTQLQPEGNGFSLQNNNLNNDWTITSRKPIADISLSGSISQRWHTRSGQTLGLNGSINYSNTYRTLTEIQNNMFGAYDITHDRSNYLRMATDDQFTNNIRWGALLGLIWLSHDRKHRVELKQIFNQIGKSRYTYRRGFDSQSDYTEQAEY